MDFQLFHGCHGCEKGQQGSHQLKGKGSMTTINGNPTRDWREVGDGGGGNGILVGACRVERIHGHITARDEWGEERV